MAQLEQLWLLYDCCGKKFLSVVSSVFTCKPSCHISTGDYFLPARQRSCFSNKHIVFIRVSSRLFMCVHTSCVHLLPANCVPLFACTTHVSLALGGWFESVSQREIVFRLCLLFPIRGQYANSRCQPSCRVLVWCLHCMTLAANHTARPPLLYPAGISSAGSLATSQLQQSGSLDRVRSDKKSPRDEISLPQRRDGAEDTSWVKWAYERLYVIIPPNKISTALVYCVAGKKTVYFLLQLCHTLFLRHKHAVTYSKPQHTHVCIHTPCPLSLLIMLILLAIFTHAWY